MTATDVVQGVYTAFAEADMTRLGELLGSTHWIEARGGPYGGTYKGLGEIGANVLGPIGEDVREFSARPDELLAIGADRVLALGTYHGLCKTGPIAIRFGHLWTVADGRIAQFEQFTDTHEWRLATGR